MATIKEVDSGILIKNLAERLEKVSEIKPPAWASFVKTGVSRQRPPQQENWWWIRSASVLRKIYLSRGMGVSRLRTVYAGRKNRGHKPEHSYRASGAIIRKILQQLEAAGFVKAEKGKGRVLTPKGQSFLNVVAKEMRKAG
jgi:small subunit ribosomal protein S19e